MINSDIGKELDLAEIVKHIIKLSEEAGAGILKVYESGFSVTDKKDDTPLTEADLAAHNIITKGLAKLTPDIPVLSEESDEISFAERSSWNRYWLIDPLDGTREFIKQNGEFTVNIALIDRGESILGVIQVPVNSILYYAWRNGGAWKKMPDSPAEKIEARYPSEEQLVVAGSRSHSNEVITNFLDKVGSHRIFPMGSSLKSCLIAEGQADLYPRLGPTSEWDTAAAQCIVEESGGQLTDTAMRPLRYNTKESLLNPHFFVFGKGEHDWSNYL
ncbi:MAG: 3'(2'),5'-bisphosphate nucleotidase CysQ [Thiotrichales bacterium]|jgi:3'(2'), 5'-bisphosphate nucleotidase|nr:3'(2'),5'-bisphosphate nucleotidase CysQ [Thiotrichales bacterium]MBT3613605.1 3'(2'),5'-bisphosphate nucleotidase CysQ [Thiotrichales bacterium]MBT3752349.1 3'(2'),5'-bisphosphate nucleotidase CysQ [Thiotrichales bacterium]MBT3837137.1 3'(2'),5'-bisphosphate nucleotidase CysQ [Thiotrichales bacterium]MBT4152986.1 3'(2'),5'-bisphosphate nucleotidase CysQ [Thiotrichales bacterium]